MRFRTFASPLILSLLLLPAMAVAQPPGSAATGIAVEAGSATPAAPNPIRRDARGVKGISPFYEALQRGDEAVLARDFVAAVSAYRDALVKEPDNALALYRLGEAQLLEGDLKEAELALTAGLRAAKSPGLKAKLQFVLADLRERQKADDEARAQWAEYEAFTRGHPDARGFPASATERKRALDSWKKVSADSAAVKARIEKGVQAADEAVRKSSK